jgi:hypothetical protein
MKRFVLAIALTGLMSVTALAGEIPTNAPVAGNIPTNSPVAATPQPTTSSTLLTNLVLTIFTLIGR